MKRNGPNRVTEVPPEHEPNTMPDRSGLASEGAAADRADDLRQGLLRLQRLMAERGIAIRLPLLTRDPAWRPPPVLLPIDADEMSAFLVRLRQSGRL